MSHFTTSMTQNDGAYQKVWTSYATIYSSKSDNIRLSLCLLFRRQLLYRDTVFVFLYLLHRAELIADLAC